jgi:phenylacetate-CoA ligase
MSPDNLERYVQHICQVQPAYLHAYPSALFALASYALAHERALPRSLRAALVESEPVLDHQRKLVQDKIGLRVFAAYGQSEKVILAAECERSELYHVVPTYGYCEVIDPAGHPVPEGQEGELTGTGFINDVMPFIRYRTGDDAILVGTGCKTCGRQHLLLDEIKGRRGQEFLVCRDGRTLVSMATLTGGLLHDDTLDGILRFQFVQAQPGKAVLQLVPTKQGAKRTREEIRQHFASRLGHGIDLEVSLVEEIPLTRIGKQPMILQRWPGIAELLRGQGVRNGSGS